MSNQERPVSICFPARKGGVGKTTLTINMAAFLANDGNRVLVVGADDQQDAADLWLASSDSYDAENHKSFAGVLKGEYPPEEAVYTTAPLRKVEYKKNLLGHVSRKWLGSQTYTFDIMPAGEELFSAVDASNERLLYDRFDNGFSQKYDYILFDIPTAWYDTTTLVYMYVQYAFIPLTDNASYKSSIMTMNEITSVQAMGYPIKCLGFIINMADGRDGSLGQYLAGSFREAYGDYVLPHTIRFSKTVWNASAFSIPLASYNKAPVLDDMYEVYRDICERIAEDRKENE